MSSIPRSSADPPTLARADRRRTEGISVTLHAAGIRSLVADLAGERAVAPEPDQDVLMEAAE
jgi:hypothetical protein